MFGGRPSTRGGALSPQFSEAFGLGQPFAGEGFSSPASSGCGRCFDVVTSRGFGPHGRGQRTPGGSAAEGSLLGHMGEWVLMEEPVSPLLPPV